MAAFSFLKEILIFSQVSSGFDSFGKSEGCAKQKCCLYSTQQNIFCMSERDASSLDVFVVFRCETLVYFDHLCSFAIYFADVRLRCISISGSTWSAVEGVLGQDGTLNSPPRGDMHSFYAVDKYIL